MAESKQKESKTKEQSQASGTCCNIEDMFKKMQNFCGGDEGSFNCDTMMQRMCQGESKGTEK